MQFQFFAITPARFGRRLETQIEAIIRGFKVQHGDANEESLRAVLIEIARYVTAGGPPEDRLASLWLASGHGLQQDRAPGFTLEELRAQYRTLRGLVLFRVGRGRPLSARTAELLGRAFALTISVSTEIFLRAQLESERRHSESTRERDLIQKEWLNFTRIFRETPEMVVVLSGPDHRFKFVNEAHKRVLGFDATGLSVREAQPESREIHGILDEVYRTGRTADLHEIPVTLGDRVRNFNLTYAAKRDLHGNIDGVMIVGIEVTDQVRAREAARLHQSVLESALGNEPMMEVFAQLANTTEVHSNGDLRALVFLWNGVAYELQAAPSVVWVGPERVSGATLGRRPERLIEFTDDPALNGLATAIADCGLEPCWVAPIVEPSGPMLGVFAFAANAKREPTPGEAQSIEIAVRTAALILGRRRQEVEIRARENEVRAERQILLEVLEQTEVPTALHLGPEHRFGFVNRSFRETFGVGELKGQSVLEVFPEGETQGFVARLDGVYRTGVPFFGRELRFERLLPSGDRQVFYMDFTYAAKRDAEGTIEGVLATHFDASERVLTRQRLEASRQAAESANEAKSAFLANMSHEIRTPLGAIMGFAELARQSGHTAEEVASYLAIVERNSVQVLRIIDDILDLAKVEAGRVTLEEMEVNLPEFLADFAALLGYRARENAIAFQLVAETDLPDRICTDPTRLRQILTNGVGNAIKFTQKGSVSLNVAYRDGRIEFGIVDTGRGITDVQAERLFNAFVQADVSTTRKFGGTGLGLVLTKRLCQLLGGDYVLERSELDVGSKFTATIAAKPSRDARMIPRDRVAFGPPPAEAPRHERAGLSGVRVLLVEDSPENQVLISLLLERAGARVSIANDGEEGARMALGGNFQVVLMDIQMPRMDGHEAVRLLRARGYREPVVALTAHAMKEEAERAFASGFSRFLTKPIQRKALVELVAELAAPPRDISPSI